MGKSFILVNRKYIVFFSFSSMGQNIAKMEIILFYFCLILILVISWQTMFPRTNDSKGNFWMCGHLKIRENSERKFEILLKSFGSSLRWFEWFSLHHNPRVCRYWNYQYTGCLPSWRGYLNSKSIGRNITADSSIFFLHKYRLPTIVKRNIFVYRWNHQRPQLKYWKNKYN